LIEAMCQRLRIPNGYRDIAVLVGRYHLLAHTLMELRAATLLELLDNLDAFRRPVRLDQFIVACEADARGRKGLENRDYPQSAMLRKAREVAAAVTLTEEERTGLTGIQIAERMRQQRIAALEKLKLDGA
jgi:tRNA nucleotidyltransferase (CCA-adding enzyme)